MELRCDRGPPQTPGTLNFTTGVKRTERVRTESRSLSCEPPANSSCARRSPSAGFLTKWSNATSTKCHLDCSHYHLHCQAVSCDVDRARCIVGCWRTNNITGRSGARAGRRARSQSPSSSSLYHPYIDGKREKLL
ncbi:unnamed protein product [Pleuronectes platessa]|uniref:Uncharacterized protein n=1 Tax=Pleuronectes platessa TaxID=8262 RepID=A0A9N7Z593_PLEPL|nr:unnamed protein product [Pleuronectes platessa]